MQDESEEAFKIGVKQIEEHEDGSATYEFLMDDRATDAMAGLGIELVLICAAYEVDLQDALDAVRSANQVADVMEAAADRIEALRARADRLEEALREIADEAAVTVHTGKNGINYKKMYEGWRKIAVDRIDIARAALTQKEPTDG